MGRNAYSMCCADWVNDLPVEGAKPDQKELARAQSKRSQNTAEEGDNYCIFPQQCCWVQ